MNLKEEAPYMYYWEFEEKEFLKEYYCEKCSYPLTWRECRNCGHDLDD